MKIVILPVKMSFEKKAKQQHILLQMTPGVPCFVARSRNLRRVTSLKEEVRFKNLETMLSSNERKKQ